MPHYPPLHLPEKPGHRRGPFARLREALTPGPTSEESNLINQIRMREPIPAEIWGDPNRARFAVELASIIAERIPWPNYYFIPEDPFELVMHVIGGEDLEYTEIFMVVEETFGIVVSDAEFETFFEWTFGEVVDYLNPFDVKTGREMVDFDPAPLTGPSSIETKTCPKLAAFIEIRRLLRTTRSYDGVTRITPSTNVRALDEADRRRLNLFVNNRFGTGPTPLHDYRPLQTAAASAAAILGTACVQGIMGVFMAFWFSDSFLEGIFYVGLFASLAFVFGVPLALFELLSVVVRRDYWRVRSRSYRQVETLGQLINWLLARRADLRRKLPSNLTANGGSAV